MSNYTTTDNVRIAAGIVGNLNISTASIEQKITMSTGVINGKIMDVYTLPLAETPSFIEQIASQLAAAFILIDEYGKEAEDTDKDGYNRLKLIYNDKKTGLLDRIQKKEIKLISDTTSTELAISSVKSPVFRPNDLSSDEKKHAILCTKKLPQFFEDNKDQIFMYDNQYTFIYQQVEALIEALEKNASSDYPIKPMFLHSALTYSKLLPNHLKNINAMQQ